ncbi:MAG TPA: hypothetical protein VMS77_09140 [Conexivisphaerales archaeon]|nr:hypothetical protein [Conexivisphaerales archaeon]
MEGVPQGTLNVVDMELGGLINPRMRHIIKRYVKKVGLREIRVEHLCDGGPATVRLVVTGVPGGRLSRDQNSKLEYLETAITKSLAQLVRHRPASVSGGPGSPGARAQRGGAQHEAGLLHPGTNA